MASISPAPNSPIPAAPPPSTTLPPPPLQSPSPPAPTTSPPPQDNSTQSPPPLPPPPSQPPILPPTPPVTPSTPSPQQPSSPPPDSPVEPPPSPPPIPPSSPPTLQTPPPPAPPSNPPANDSPPPPPAENSPPPPDIQPPPSTPPQSSPPPPPPPPPTPSQPPTSSPIPPSSSPPPPASLPPRSPSLPPPPPLRPISAPPPSNASPPPPTPPNSRPNSTQSTPPPANRLAPPSPLSSSPPSSVNDTTPNASDSSNQNGGHTGIGTDAIVGISVAVGILFLSLIGVAVWCVRKRRKAISRVNGDYEMPSTFTSSPMSDSSLSKAQSTTAPLMGSGISSDFINSPPAEPSGLGHSRLLFTYEEMVTATNGFSLQNLLGEGGFGCVYKGCLPDGREVAVKQLNIGGSQGEREFKAEVDIISRVHHRHLVSLVGYCISDSQRLLVYDYVPNNTLDFHLHGEGIPVLDWTKRIKIAAGAARGLAYLHEDCHPRIIHRDIKSSNILLDNNFEALVSDFGLAKLNPDANTHITTRVMGTYGYVAPEYVTSGKLTEKSDVYSFGVVLLELITGQKPVDPSQSPGKESLVERARPFLSHALVSGELGGLIDPRLDKNYNEAEMLRMIESAAACVRHSAAKRPRMGQIVRALDDIAAADLTNGMKIGESEVIRRTEESAQLRFMQRMAFGDQDFSSDFFTHSTINSRNDSQV